MDSLKQSKKKSDKRVPSLWTRLQLGYIARSIRGCPPRLLPGRMRHRRPHIISLDKGSDIGSLRDDKASPGQIPRRLDYRGRAVTAEQRVRTRLR
ncbi:unnamed protein product [Fusarium graminearum]|nr:unnamed protein product [Fusarium graminearum]